MKKNVSLFVFLCCLIQFTGCATIISGKHQDVPMNSDPSGAIILVNGVERGTTPATIELRRKDDHEVTFEKAGYLPKTQWMQTKTNGWIFGNIILGGIIGIIIDWSTGAKNKFEPEELNIQLSQG